MPPVIRHPFPWLIVLLAAAALGLLAPLAGTGSANHTNRVLDVSPEAQLHELGATHTFTADLCDFEFDPGPPESATCEPEPATFQSGPINVDFENEGGTNDDGATRLTPDLTCSVKAGESSCTVSYVGGSPGTDRWRAWIDHDGSNLTDDSDSDEPVNESAENPTQHPDADSNCFGAPDSAEGSTNGEPDCTDVVTVGWTGGAPATVDCDDETGPNTEREVNPSGGAEGNETYICHVRDAQGGLTGDWDPAQVEVQDVYVYGEVETSNVNDPDDGTTHDTPDYSCLVGAGRRNEGQPVGRCQETITQGDLQEGGATICFWVDDSTPTEGTALCGAELVDEQASDTGSNTVGGDAADKVEKIWQERGVEGGGADVEPEVSAGTVGVGHGVQVTIYDQFGDALHADTSVRFEFFAGSPSDGDGNTAETPDGTCTTRSSSTCSFDYTNAGAPGRDLLCVWVNGTPTLSGTSQNGSCGVESHEDVDDAVGSFDPPQPAGDDVDLVAVTWRKPAPATRINCEAETAAVRRGRIHRVYCSAFRGSAAVAGMEIDLEMNGRFDPDASNSLSTPDRSCTTGSAGWCVFAHFAPVTGSPGTTLYRAWMDDDYFDGTIDADVKERRDETQRPGTARDSDSTDVVQDEWVPNPRRTVSINSSRSTQVAGRYVRIIGTVNGDAECEEG